MSESAIAVRGNQIQRGDRQWRAALSGHGKDLRRLQSIRDDPPAAVAIINTEPRLQEDGIGPGRDALKDRREDVPEAHLFPRPDRIQQNASSNLPMEFADYSAHREPSLVATPVANHTDVERVIVRALPVAPFEACNRPVGR